MLIKMHIPRLGGGNRPPHHEQSMRIYILFYFVVAVQLLSRVRLFVILWTTALQASLSFTISWSLLKLMSNLFYFSSSCIEI